jgi:hypothetical protein
VTDGNQVAGLTGEEKKLKEAADTGKPLPLPPVGNFVQPPKDEGREYVPNAETKEAAVVEPVAPPSDVPATNAVIPEPSEHPPTVAHEVDQNTTPIIANGNGNGITLAEANEKLSPVASDSSDPAVIAANIAAEHQKTGSAAGAVAPQVATNGHPVIVASGKGVADAILPADDEAAAVIAAQRAAGMEV